MANLNQTELLAFAKDFIEERITALEKDVKHCLTSPFAPFPAVSYCFSTINLLGELSIRRRAGNRTDSDYQTQTYMQTYMNYNSEQTELLMQIFRHKLAHLAIPHPLFIDNQGRRIVWIYFHQDTGANLHLQLTPATHGAVMTPSQAVPSWQIPYSHEFILSIGRFLIDIMNSVDDHQGNGYLPDLMKSQTLQSTFKDAICEIYPS